MAADTHAPDQTDADDGLEPPTLNARLLAWVGVGALAFILAAIAVLTIFFRLLLTNPADQPIHAMPTPRLETSIDPRLKPATPEPGPAPPALPPSPHLPAAEIQRAMQAVAAKGQHAFDPLPAPAGNAAP
jgi:hypothetical protein